MASMAHDVKRRKWGSITDMSGFGDIIMSKVEEYEKHIHELMTKSSIRANKKYDDLMGNSVLRCPICGSERIAELPDNSLLEGNDAITPTPK